METWSTVNLLSFPSLVFLLLGNVAVETRLSNFFPGTSCGLQTEIRISEDVPDAPEDRKCLIISNAKKYRDFIANQPRWVYTTPWSSCPVICGGGQIHRSRVCQRNLGVVAPEECGGTSESLEVTMYCNTHLCSQWDSWDPWSTCTHICAGGTRTRERLCRDTLTDSIVDGPNCAGSQSEDQEPCNTEPCPGPLWSEWDPWTECTADCDGGVQSTQRRCIGTDGITAIESSYCGVPDKQIDVPCNTDPCPPPAPCPTDQAFAIADGRHCCKHYRRKTDDTCDGNLIENGDPVDCCFDSVSCHNFPGICLTRTDPISLCPTVVGAGRYDSSDIGYLVDFTVSRNKKEAALFCRDVGGKLPRPVNADMVNSMVAALIDQDGSGKWSWVGLTSPIPVNCLDASCNGLLFWDEDGSAYTHVDNIFSRVAFPKIAGASAVFVPDLISPLSSSLIHRHPSTNLEATICQIQCTPYYAECPWTHPFALADGSQCCKFYTRKNDSDVDPLCDGGTLDVSDPVGCCAYDDVVSCPNPIASGCVNNPNSHEYCPTVPSAHRIGDYGFTFDPSVMKNWRDSDLQCISDIDGRLPRPKTPADVAHLHGVMHLYGVDEYEIWLGLHSESRETLCDNAACDGKDLFWNDGSQFKYIEGTYSMVHYAVNSETKCSRMVPDDVGDSPHLSQLLYTVCSALRVFVCQTDCRPHPSSCPESHPYAMNFGSHCCKFNKRKLDQAVDVVCDGQDVTFVDPVECCLEDDLIICNNIHDGCVDHPLAQEICSAFPDAGRSKDWGFLSGSTDALKFWDHAKICFDSFSGTLPRIKDEADLRILTETMPDINTWVSMFKSEAVECTTAACQDYEFYWDDGDPLLVDFDIFENVFFTLHDRCVVLDTFPPIHSLADYHDYKCEDLQHAMCAVPCHGEPSKCPVTHPYVIHGGLHCCSAYKRIDDSSVNSVCDGQDIQKTDPIECCFDALECPGTNGRGCINQYNARALCPRYLSARRYDSSDVGYIVDNSASRSKWEAAIVCAELGAKLPVPVNAEMVHSVVEAAWDQNGWVPAFWLGLNSPDPVSCLNAACDGLLFWDDGTPYTFVGGIFNHVLFHPQAGAGGILLPNTGNPLGSLLEHRFLSTKLLITVCQVDCHPETPSKCPVSHPFAFASGTLCCEYFTRKNDSSIDPLCDGGPLQIADPAACCPREALECSNSIYGCEDNPGAFMKCPTSPSLFRIGSYGYILNGTLRNSNDADNFCIDNFDARLPRPKTSQDVTDIHIMFHATYVDELNFHAGLKSVSGYTTCDDQDCNNQDLVWNDGTTFVYEAGAFALVRYRPSSVARCSVFLADDLADNPGATVLHYETCTTLHYTACQADCTPRKCNCLLSQGLDSFLNTRNGVQSLTSFPFPFLNVLVPFVFPQSQNAFINTWLLTQDPSSCPKTHPFALGSGQHCCKYNKRKFNTTINALCDGQDIEFDDPVECCIQDEVTACTNAFEGCVDHPLAPELCSAFPNASRSGDWGFIPVNTDLKSFWQHAKICFDEVSGTLPMIKTEADMQSVSSVAALETWVSMKNPTSLQCSGAPCPQDLYWDDGDLFDDEANWFSSISLTQSDTCMMMSTNQISTREATLVDLRCNGGRYAVCAAPCHGEPSKCPTSHPFAVNQGLHCCATYKKTNDPGVNAACDGTDFHQADPVECCQDAIQCTDTNDRGCISQYNAEEICPGHAEFSRHGDKGYLFQDYGMTKEDAKAFCNDNHGTNLFMPKKAEELDFFLYVLLQAAGVDRNVWLGLENPSATPCENAECDDLLQWQDGTPYKHEDGLTTSADTTSCLFIDVTVLNIRASQYLKTPCTTLHHFACETSCAP